MSKRRSIIVILMLLLLAGAGVSGLTTNAAARSHARHHAAAEPVPEIPLNQIHVLGDRPAPFALEARAAMLIAAHSGTVLYAYNEHEKMEPASLAKIMTFYLTLKALRDGRLKLTTPVTISEKAWRLSVDRSVSHMFLGLGQRVPVEQLLYGLMVSSGNDAAVALAEYQAGSTEAFTEEMNRTAKELGLTETHFANPDGLPMDGEYTTAADMVKLAHIVIEQFPDAVKYTGTKEFTFDNIHQRNFNTLLFYDSRVDGLKTGHVQAAGFHLVATAHANGMLLISAVMGTPSMEKRRTETEKLLNWAFNTFVTVQPDWQKAAPATLRVYEGAAREIAIGPQTSPYITVGRGEESKVSLAASFKSKYLVAPIAKGVAVGELQVMVNGKNEGSIPLVTRASVAQAGLIGRLSDRVRMML
ncbi:MAG TPA: D-alanyl-D-alanine carboxypeptidase family protein [Candidatus Binataceae bacterium]|nr:D-alanyl-D-alanine carboxypeptidase family protein [Candidatus Binataceae bacterium]